MVDRIVVLKENDAFTFVADGCAALADAMNQLRVSREGDHELEAAYAEMVVAYSRLVLHALPADRSQSPRVQIIGHLVERLRQAQAGEVTLSVLDIVDRLHAELENERAPV